PGRRATRSRTRRPPLSPREDLDMVSREQELAGLPATHDPPRGLLPAFLGPLVDPFRRGVPPKPRPPTGFYTDTTVCIGCKACEVACKQWNQLPADGFAITGNSYDNTGHLGATTWRHVQFIEQAKANSSRQEQRWLMMSDVCKQCANAACLEACPTGALIRTEFDTVYVQQDICNGCGFCVPACPFGVID